MDLFGTKKKKRKEKCREYVEDVRRRMKDIAKELKDKGEDVNLPQRNIEHYDYGLDSPDYFRQMDGFLRQRRWGFGYHSIAISSAGVRVIVRRSEDYSDTGIEWIMGEGHYPERQSELVKYIAGKIAKKYGVDSSGYFYRSFGFNQGDGQCYDRYNLNHFNENFLAVFYAQKEMGEQLKTLDSKLEQKFGIKF